MHRDRAGHSVPRTPPKPSPLERPAVRLRAPRPHAALAPVSGSTVRYVADGDGFIEAAVDHVEALLRAGCKRVDQP
jgi:hypothetical protein